MEAGGVAGEVSVVVTCSLVAVEDLRRLVRVGVVSLLMGVGGCGLCC